MNNYELMFIVRPTLDEASIKKVYEDMQNVVLNQNVKYFNKIYKHKKIRKNFKDKFQLVVEANKETVAEFNRIANVNENVIRHLIIKQEN